MEHGKENPPSYSQAPAAPYPAAPAQYPPAPPHPSNAHTYPPNNSGQTVIQVEAQPQVIIVGGCPKCRVGVLKDKFTLCGWCWLIWCFPCGLICFFNMRQKRCIHCHQRF
ncbi:brain protein I3-like isoform X1 [Daphnia pulicaria]|uniref:brain protein I3-like isoform X1 n=1 Tax=Daphnia pulicaria TaxID=35523 RepID=UPI001EEBC519|nr:brain protein I3-like isoform X1 [Daphnia pulicaria]